MSGNPNYPKVCPIWGTVAAYPCPPSDDLIFYDSPRAGGKFSMARPTETDINENPHLMMGSVDASVKARLTSWLIEQRHRQKEEFPEVTCDSIRNAQARLPLKVAEIADNFLRYLAQLQNFLGSSFVCCSFVRSHENFFHLLAHIESEIEIYEFTDQQNGLQKIRTYLYHLHEKEWIQMSHGNHFEDRGCLTADGYGKLEELNSAFSSSDKAFMAMWFDPSMKEAWNSGFKLGIRRAGYHPYRIDEEEHVEKIDDRIRDEIPKAKFVVADLTGDRGGVYYEAGFAHALSIPVIFTRRKDSGDTHFDIHQYNCITWDDKNLEKLQEDLANRITAILGGGPGKQTI